MSTEVDRPEREEPTARLARNKLALVVAGLFAVLVVVFHANDSLLDEGDAVPNTYLPATILRHGWLSFTPDEFPELFMWQSKTPLSVTPDFFVRRWDQQVGLKTAAEWRRSGHLAFNKDRYYVVESPERGTYVSTFGPVPGLTFLPLAAAVYAVDSGFPEKAILRLSAAKLHASMLVAGIAVLLFLLALEYTTWRRSLLLAVAYGLGTGAWSVASQNLWQQTVNAFFLVLGAWAFVTGIDRPKRIVVAGLALGIAVASRSTSLLVLVAVGIYLALYHRRTLLPFVAGAVPGPLGLAAYNYYYFGNPLTLAQAIIGRGVALEKTGTEDLWQTPLWEGAAGLLASPSRGLLVFSTFLAFSAWGVVRIWRDPRYRPLRPLTLAAVVVMGMQCKWFDWWGGWTYGYRPWLDMVPYLVLFLVPVIDDIWEGRVKRWVFVGALGWSIFAQGLGAFAYDKMWNQRILHVVRLPRIVKPFGLLTAEAAIELAKTEGGTYLGPTMCNIDNLHCRHRLWSLEDNIIGYYLTNFREGRENRLRSGWEDLSL